jgi:tetratricopeptide (TPR) repeat protein
MLKHPVFGTGPETFSVAFPQAQSPDLSRAFPEFYHESAHNIFLDAGESEGLPGLLFLLAAVVYAFRMHRRGPLIAGFIAVLVCHQFSVFTIPTALTFWLLITMLNAPERQHAAPPRFRLALLPVCLILLVPAIRTGIGDRHLARMRDALDHGQQADARREYQAASRWGMHADLWYSRKLLSSTGMAPTLVSNLATTQEALAAGLSATRTVDDPANAWMNLGLLYATLGNVQQTEHAIHQAILSSPNWYKPHLALAQLLAVTNKKPEAAREFVRARELNPKLAVNP